MPWTRLPQEYEGDHAFSGQIYMTRGVESEIPPQEIAAIVTDLRNFIRENGPVHYFQMYENRETEQKIYWINELGEGVKNSGKYTAEEISEMNYSTILFPHEY